MAIPMIVYACINFFFLVLSQFMVSPILPVVLLRVCDHNSSKAALYNSIITGVGSLCMFIASPYLGHLSDRKGRKPFFFLSAVASLISFGGVLSIYYFPSKYWIVFITAAISGSLNTLFSMSYSYVADFTLPQDRNKYFGFVAASAGLGIVVGPLIVTGVGLISKKKGISDWDSLFYSLIIGAFFSLVNIIFSFIMPESIQQKARLSRITGDPDTIDLLDKPEESFFVELFSSFKHLFSIPMVVGLVIAFMLHTTSTLGLQSTSSVYYQTFWGWGSIQLALSYAAFGLSMSFVQGFMIKPLVHYVGPRSTIIGGFLLGGLTSIPYGFIKDGWYVFAVIPFKAMGVIAIPVIQGMISQQYHPSIQGKVLGALGGCQVLSNFIGPVIFSLTYDYFNSHHAVIYYPQIIFFEASALELLGVLVLIIVFYVFRDGNKYTPLAIINTSENSDSESTEEVPVHYNHV